MHVIGRPVTALSLLMLIGGALLAAGPVRAGEAEPPAPAPAVEAPVPVTPDTVAVLKGRWEGQWQLDDGSRGTVRLQIQQADATRVEGVLRVGDTAWAAQEEQLFAVTPRLDDGRVVLDVPAGPVTLAVVRSGAGWRLAGSGLFAPTGQAIRYDLARGAVLRRAPPDIAAVREPQPARPAASPLPADWYRRGAFMEIHVRSYRDSNGDGSGDLRGLISRLDYLQQLGIRGVWLMPIFASQDHDHGYAVVDYRAVEPAYGTVADVQDLVREAHARGIGIILDYVMNHSGTLHPIFANAADTAANPVRDWYLWQDTKPDDWSIYGRYPWYKNGLSWYFAGFGGGMPDWNLTNDAVVKWHQDNLRYWLNLGVDGFRFDAVGNLVENGPAAWESQPENYTLMRRMAETIAAYPGRYVVCEAPHDPLGFARACGSAFAFNLNKHMVRAARGSGASLTRMVEEVGAMPPDMAVMVSNHDAFAGRRAADQLRGDVAGLRLLAATYLTLPGIPFVYYGEEIGQMAPTGQGADQELRSPMSWTSDPATAGFTTGTPYRPVAANVATSNVATALEQPDSLLNWYRALLQLRQTSTALAGGSFEQPVVQGQTLSFVRAAGKERVLVLINYGSEAAPMTVARLPAGVALQPLTVQTTGALRVGRDGTVAVTLPARSFALYRY